MVGINLFGVSLFTLFAILDAQLESRFELRVFHQLVKVFLINRQFLVFTAGIFYFLNSFIAIKFLFHALGLMFGIQFFGFFLFQFFTVLHTLCKGGFFIFGFAHLFQFCFCRRFFLIRCQRHEFRKKFVNRNTIHHVILSPFFIIAIFNSIHAVSNLNIMPRPSFGNECNMISLDVTHDKVIVYFTAISFGIFSCRKVGSESVTATNLFCRSVFDVLNGLCIRDS